MDHLFEIFSLTSQGDAALGLNSMREDSKVNQPPIKEQQQYNFVPLFQQPKTFSFLNTETDTDNCKFQWLNYSQNSNY